MADAISATFLQWNLTLIIDRCSRTVKTEVHMTQEQKKVLMLLVQVDHREAQVVAEMSENGY